MILQLPQRCSPAPSSMAPGGGDSGSRDSASRSYCRRTLPPGTSMRAEGSSPRARASIPSRWTAPPPSPACSSRMAQARRARGRGASRRTRTGTAAPSGMSSPWAASRSACRDSSSSSSRRRRAAEAMWAAALGFSSSSRGRSWRRTRFRV